MAGVSRRTFLGRGSMAVAAAGVLSSVPGSRACSARASQKPLPPTPLSPDRRRRRQPDEPLVAHVRDLSTGEISLFNGTREVIVRDPQLANQPGPCHPQ